MQTEKNILTLRSDRCGEYLKGEFLDYLKENEILSQWTPPYTPQLNGVSERRNRTLLDMVRSMMSRAVLPKSFWGYALKTSCHTLNRVPSKSVDKTPYELWKGKRPNLSYIKIWGCDAYLKRVESDKLEAKSDKCLFVGYPKETVGCYFYNPIEMKVIISKHVVFLRKNSGSKVDLEEVQETTNKIDQLDVPMAELSSDEVQIEKVGTTSSQGHTSSANLSGDVYMTQLEGFELQGQTRWLELLENQSLQHEPKRIRAWQILSRSSSIESRWSQDDSPILNERNPRTQEKPRALRVEKPVAFASVLDMLGLGHL
ncbi:Integrase catalytic domain-containing protein [Abeliophyllum distichum]|uniref:Integrase catalytic domain-containing protein n=1 Tax=Abeliophyllum distichum TaxID=126358 RepID=A0ABD1VXQ1_9LAMI